MLNFVSQAIARRLEPRGGQFIDFEEAQGTSLAWRKCEVSWDSIYIQDFNRVEAQKKVDKERKMREQDDDDDNDDESETDPTEGMSTSFNLVEQEQRRQGLAVTNRKVPITTAQPPMSGTPLSGAHAIVNTIRKKEHRNLEPLIRTRELDDLARHQAEKMAQEKRVFHSDPTVLADTLQEAPQRRLGENVFRAKSNLKLNLKMTERASNYANMTDPKYTSMGIATAKDSKGVLYQCQIFRG